jgi:hypothetical protein
MREDMPSREMVWRTLDGDELVKGFAAKLFLLSSYHSKHPTGITTCQQQIPEFDYHTLTNIY